MQRQIFLTLVKSSHVCLHVLKDGQEGGTRGTPSAATTLLTVPAGESHTFHVHDNVIFLFTYSCALASFCAVSGFVFWTSCGYSSFSCVHSSQCFSRDTCEEFALCASIYFRNSQFSLAQFSFACLVSKSARAKNRPFRLPHTSARAFSALTHTTVPRVHQDRTERETQRLQRVYDTHVFLCDTHVLCIFLCRESARARGRRRERTALRYYSKACHHILVSQGRCVSTELDL